MTTTGQRTTSESWKASTDSLAIRDVAFSVDAARRWMACFLWVSNSASAERTASVSCRAGTDGNMVTNFTIGVNTAGADTRIHAMLVHAG